jgi:manganese/zinc/iron transport system permease protein
MSAFLGDFVAVLLHPTADDLTIMGVGALVAAASALLGCFLILQRLAMLGDAISHAVLPGIVLAFLWSGSRNIVPLLMGAAAMGMITTFATDFLQRKGRLQSDASIGVTFTFLFAVGVILVSRYAGAVDIDLDCVVSGEIIYAPFERFEVMGRDLGAASLWTMGLMTALNLGFVALFWKQLKICSFDPGLAASLGIRIVAWHYALMALVSMTTVAAFESVGVILVIAMLIVPANTAYLLTDRLSLMLVLAAGAGILSAVVGYALASALDASVSGAMGTVAGVLYALAAVFSPKHGVLPTAIRRRRIGPNPTAA